MFFACPIRLTIACLLALVTLPVVAQFELLDETGLSEIDLVAGPRFLIRDGQPHGTAVNPASYHVVSSDSTSGTPPDNRLRRPVAKYFGGAELLVARPHFSEAVAYAVGTQTASSYSVSGRPIEFNYDANFRGYFGGTFCGYPYSWRARYTSLQGDVGINGGGVGAGQFIADPFGNVVGTVTIIDPSDARFGTNVVGGDRIETFSTVDTRVYDLDLSRTWATERCWAMRIDAGVRIADIEQTYRSIITLAAAPVSDGYFAADFTGAGPHLGLAFARRLNPESRFSVAASAHTALLLGDYDVASINDQGGGTFVAAQSHTQRRTLSVLETELLGSWQVTDSIELSCGWLFHWWNDLGVSGGTFGGLFNGADDANNMSFDGLILRAEVRI